MCGAKKTTARMRWLIAPLMIKKNSLFLQPLYRPVFVNLSLFYCSFLCFFCQSSTLLSADKETNQRKGHHLVPRCGPARNLYPLEGYSAESLTRFLRSLCPVFWGAARLREMANTENPPAFGIKALHSAD